MAKREKPATPLAVERVPLMTIMLDPANVRSHPTRNLEAIKASLVRFGQQTPIVLDASDVVRKGNGTVLAARELGWESILAVRTKLEGPEATAYAIADNRTAELAAWDDRPLAATLEALSNEGFDLADVGFTDAELQGLMAKIGDEIIAEGDGGGLAPPESVPGGRYGVIVECRDEAHQAEVYERLQSEGLECRVVCV